MPKSTDRDIVAELSNLNANLEQIAQYIASNDPRNFPDEFFTSLLNLRSPSAVLATKDARIAAWTPFVEMAIVTGRLEALVDACVAVCEANESYGSSSSAFESGFMFLALCGYIAEDQVGFFVFVHQAKIERSKNFRLLFFPSGFANSAKLPFTQHERSERSDDVLQLLLHVDGFTDTAGSSATRELFLFRN